MGSGCKPPSGVIRSTCMKSGALGLDDIDEAVHSDAKPLSSLWFCLGDVKTVSNPHATDVARHGLLGRAAVAKASWSVKR